MSARRSFKGETFLQKNWVRFLVFADVVQKCFHSGLLSSHFGKEERPRVIMPDVDEFARCAIAGFYLVVDWPGRVSHCHLVFVTGCSH